MSDNIASLDVARAKPDLDVVEGLRHLLAKAESGELRRYCIVFNDGGVTLTSCKGGGGNRWETIGLLEVLKHDLIEGSEL